MTRTSKKITKSGDESISDPQPEVIVDFEYEKGLLFIIIENIGESQAHDVSIRFNKRIVGMQNTKMISTLKIFESLKFLPPGKKIKILVDTFQSYVYHKQPMEIRLDVTFRNKTDRQFKNVIIHDLSIYNDLAEV